MRRDALENQQKILSAAMALFNKEGVAGVGMKQIASHARIGVGTLYRNYPNKSALCMALVYDSMQHFIDSTSVYLSQTKAVPKEQFNHVLHSYLEFRENNIPLLNSIENSSSLKQGTVFYQSDIYLKLVYLFQQVLNRMQPDKSAKALQFQADMLIAMLKSDIYAFERRDRGLTNDEILSNIMDIFSPNMR